MGAGCCLGYQPDKKYLDPSQSPSPLPPRNEGEEISDEGGDLRNLYKLSEEEMEKNPHNLIGLIQGFNDWGQPIGGTGILISPDLVLTSAHNLFDPQTGEHLKILFYPKQCGVLEKFQKDNGNCY
jgi:hypothetical protein